MSKRNILLIFVPLLLVTLYSPSNLVSATVQVEERTTSSYQAVESETHWRDAPWFDDFDTAVRTAKEASKNLLIYFETQNDSSTLLNETEERFVPHGNGTIRQVAYTPESMQQPLAITEACRKFEMTCFADSDVLECLDDYVLVRLSREARTTDKDGHSVVVLETPIFEEMQRLPGLAVVDFEHPEEPYYEQLVGILPFVRAKAPTPEQTLTFLTLPPGTLTQRTLVYAVRIHPERPLSAFGSPEPVLLKEARDHAEYQSKTGVLGHQNFGARTSRIASVLGVGAAEICAQSWSGDGLYEGAISCVRSWRTSPPHWRNVLAGNRYYGYDMVRGRNNIWYAVGLVVK